MQACKQNTWNFPEATSSLKHLRFVGAFLTHFSPALHFHTPFSGGIEM